MPILRRRIVDGESQEMNDVIKVGDTICCHDYADMMDVISELTRQGYIATAQAGSSRAGRMGNVE